jgi:hypothetical protein
MSISEGMQRCSGVFRLSYSDLQKPHAISSSRPEGRMDSYTKADYDEVESIHNLTELLKALKEKNSRKKVKFRG